MKRLDFILGLVLAAMPFARKPPRKYGEGLYGFGLYGGN